MYPVSGGMIIATIIWVGVISALTSIPVVVFVLLVRWLLARRIWMLPLGYWRAGHLVVWSVAVTLPVAVVSNKAAELVYEELLNTVLLRVWGLSLICLSVLLLIPWWHVTAFADPAEPD